MKEFKKSSFLNYIWNALKVWILNLSLLNALMYSLTDRKINFLNFLCLVCATDCPVFEVKTKVNVSVPSGVIHVNRSKPIDFTKECFRLLILSKARTRCDDMTKNQPSNNFISLFNVQILYFPLCLVKGDGLAKNKYLSLKPSVLTNFWQE